MLHDIILTTAGITTQLYHQSSIQFRLLYRKLTTRLKFCRHLSRAPAVCSGVVRVLVLFGAYSAFPTALA